MGDEGEVEGVGVEGEEEEEGDGIEILRLVAGDMRRGTDAPDRSQWIPAATRRMADVHQANYERKDFVVSNYDIVPAFRSVASLWWGYRLCVCVPRYQSVTDRTWILCY